MPLPYSILSDNARSVQAALRPPVLDRGRRAADSTVRPQPWTMQQTCGRPGLQTSASQNGERNIKMAAT